jgi:hypothetical protein
LIGINEIWGEKIESAVANFSKRSSRKFWPEKSGEKNNINGAHMSTHFNTDLIRKFWQLFNDQKWDTAGELLHTNFQALWPQSREKMTAKNFIEMNRHYPGYHKIEVIHAFETGYKVLTTVWIEADTGQKTFANSIFDIQDGKILKVEEYWAEPYPAPESRRQWVELY